jgi:hypothetical protein
VTTSRWLVPAPAATRTSCPRLVWRMLKRTCIPFRVTERTCALSGMVCPIVSSERAPVLAEAVDRAGLVLHGHAHRGSERGETAGGVAVRNVAWPVTGRPYTVFHFGYHARRNAGSPTGQAPAETTNTKGA